jgi:poly-gamma-glutamate capsule biosynthesis protein CapA/YwtB (metallophosphatase superfamily)
MASIRSAAALAVLTGVLAGCAARQRPATPAAPPAAPGPAPAAPALPGHGGNVEAAPSPAPAPRALARATLAAVGDVLMHEAVKRSAEAHRRDAADGGYSWLYAPIADLLSQTDLTFANLETPIAPGSSSGTREFVFNAPPEALAALRRAGVDLVSVANNHAFDQGRPGFEETLRRVEAAGLRAVGAGPADRPAGPVRVEAGGLVLAFLGWAHFFNQEGNECPAAKPGAPPCTQAALLDRARAVDAVREAAAHADAVVVSLHWGTEYEAQPRAEDVAFAHQLADAGALVVLGHHPHVLQPVELYRRSDGATAVIAYSLGNFVSNQSRKYVHGVTPEKAAATRDGALLRVALVRRDYGRGVTRTEVDGADFVPLWTENDTAEIDRKKEPDRRPAIRVVAIDRALAEVRAELARMPDPVPAQARERFVSLRRREALLASRRAAIAGVLGEDLLRDITTEGHSAVSASRPPDPPARSGAASSGCPCARPCPEATPAAAR